MLDYAASRPRIGARRSNPNAMLAIISLHIALLAAVMSAKMDLPSKMSNVPTSITLIRDPQPPPENDVRPKTQPQQRPLDYVPPKTPQTQVSNQATDLTTPLSGPGEISQPFPPLPPLPLPTDPPARLAPASTGPQLLTPTSEIKPPYPQSKLLTGEEAVLKLRLSIDPTGRVAAVEAIGDADRVFLDAARRYLVAHWRYKPATQDGQPVASSVVITLKFQLDA